MKSSDYLCLGVIGRISQRYFKIGLGEDTTSSIHVETCIRRALSRDVTRTLHNLKHVSPVDRIRHQTFFK